MALSKMVSLTANLMQGIFQGLSVNVLHSPVALSFHPEEERLGLGARLELTSIRV